MREKILLNSNWRFHLGDIETVEPLDKEPVYMQAKSQEKRFGPAAREYKDKVNDFSQQGDLTSLVWQNVTLPHDYIIGQNPSPDTNFSLGGFHYQNAWYRYHFRLEETDRNKRIAIYFEGIAVQAVVYLNGCLLERNHCGYTSFEVDITDYLDFENDNVLAVYVDATSRHEGWWYEGAGIYRPIWMIKTEKVSVDLYGVYVNPCKKDEHLWEVPIEITVRNAAALKQQIAVCTCLLQPDGTQVAQVESTFETEGKSKQTIHLLTCIRDPKLWDIKTPGNRYTVVTKLYQNGEEIDCVSDKFGFRTIRFDADEGFFLNEEHVVLKGVNCHQDYGLTGKAVPDRVQRYKLRLMKEMGANAFRCSHYPHSEVTMEALDEMGFLVLAETRRFGSTRESLEQLEMLIKRDRNHPSVILWSIGNEEPGVLTESGLRITQTMKATVKRLDTSRPVLAALCHDPINAPAVEPLEVLGVNYKMHMLDDIHKKHPTLPIASTECCATGTTRGWYLPDDPVKGYLSAYDKDTNTAFLAREKTWKFLMARPWIMGCFQWDGIEHRGEATYPRLCSQSGAVDLYLQKKDAFYQNQSHWLETPMIHVMPHWNFQGLEGESIRVVTYTNCEEAELFLNGRSLGRKQLEAYGHGEWQVAYEPGILKAVGYIDGKEIVSDRVETSGKPYALKLRVEAGAPSPDGSVLADGKDVAVLTCYVVDEQGRIVPDAEPEITFSTNELGTVLGTGSDICDTTSPVFHTRKMRAGLCSLVVQAGKMPGILKVYAKAQNLRMAVIDVVLQ